MLHGAPISTFDLDLVHSREPGNVTRLLAALEKLKARYRDPAGREIKPSESALLSEGHQLLLTSAGPLDLLGKIGKGRDYGQLLPDTVEVEMSDGLVIRALTLKALIREKEEAGREKDRAVLAVLRRTLEETS